MNRRYHLPADWQYYPLPRPPAPAIAPTAFVLISPLVCTPGVAAPPLAVQQWLYQFALEQAQAVARPSLLERDLLAVWN
jgi:hypothetical protein